MEAMAYAENKSIITKICLILAITTVIRASNPTTPPIWPHTQYDLQNLQGYHQDNCPDIQLPYGSNSTCVLSDHCRKATCISQSLNRTGPLGYMVLTVQLYGCCQAVRAKVTLDSVYTRRNWWYTFGDGEKVRLPMTRYLVYNPPDLVVGLVFLKVELTKVDSTVHFKLDILASEKAFKFATLVEGDVLAPKCGK
ncbi:hypothetical protein ACROYT_G029605 [Oculina patagonica]